MKRALTILFFLIAFAATTQAQTRRSKVDYLQIRLDQLPATIPGSGTIFYDEADSLIKMRMTDGSIFIFGDTSNAGADYSPWDTTATAIIQKDTTWNVGVGTITPQARLHVSSSDTTGIEIAHLENNSAAATMALHSHADSSAIYLAQSGNYQAGIGIEGLTKDFRIYGGLTQLAIAIDTSNAYTFYDSIGEPAMSIHPEGDVIAHKGLSVSNGTTSQGKLYFVEDLDNGTNTVVLKTPASLAASYDITLPPDNGNANEVLTTNGSGVTSWTPTIWTDESTSPSDSIISWTTYDGEKIIIEKDYEDYFIRTNDNSEGIAVGNENRAQLYVDNLNKRTQLLSGTTEGITLDGNQKFFAVSINDSARFWIDSTGKVIVVGTTDSYALPTNDGNANEVLTTNGSGVTSWTNNSWTALNDSTISRFNGNDTISIYSINGRTSIGTTSYLGIGWNVAEHNIAMQQDSVKILVEGYEVLKMTNDDIKCYENILPANSGIQNLGTASNRWNDGLINSIYTSSIADNNSTVNTTASDTATINAISGRFRKDATGAAFTLTNSYISTASIILLTPANAAIDATATTWTVAAASGSATITFNAAPTANFDMNFLVIN